MAESGWLAVLRTVAGPRTVVTPDAVATELREGLHLKPHLQQVLDASWIVTRTLSNAEELQAFALFSGRLVVGRRNVGEAAVLAYAKVHGAIAVIDDGPGRKAARDAGIELRPTLALLCAAVREGLLTAKMISNLADHLLETEYRLPFQPGGFERWANDNGLI